MCAGKSVDVLLNLMRSLNSGQCGLSKSTHFTLGESTGSKVEIARYKQNLFVLIEWMIGIKNITWVFLEPCCIELMTVLCQF